MAELTLHKYESLKNDFLLLFDDEVSSEVAKQICDRDSGVGADGLICISREGEAFRMLLWNSDGSRGKMTGNGARCMGHGIVDKGLAEEGVVHLETDAGARWVNVGPERDGERRGVVNMGEATISEPNEALRDLLKGTFPKGTPRASFVDVGNPHFVVLSQDASLEEFGDAAQSRFGDGINVELIDVTDKSNVNMKVFERGAGITQACGTGCVAVAAACLDWELIGRHVVVHQSGGNAELELRDNEWLLAANSARVGEFSVTY